jgi:DNA-binding CsgD family transcriptional regulator
MSLRWRPMELGDVAECVRMVAENPVVGPRYGKQIKCLEAAWMNLLGREGMRTAITKQKHAGKLRIAAAGVSVFVRDSFIQELKTSSSFWFGPELARRITTGESPVLSDREVCAANSGEGLNLLVWERALSQDAENAPAIFGRMVEAYIEVHRGYFLREMVTAQAESRETLQWAIDAGGLYWDPQHKEYVKSVPNIRTAHNKPHIVGLTRDLEWQRLGSWVGILFEHRPPRFGFSRSEQKLLGLALEGDRGTDEELAEQLGVSLATVKKMWLSIYRRVAEQAPDSVPDFPRTEAGGSQRGKEKRRLILAYLRDHPEELRPVSQKRLAKKNGNSNRLLAE